MQYTSNWSLHRRLKLGVRTQRESFDADSACQIAPTSVSSLLTCEFASMEDYFARMEPMEAIIHGLQLFQLSIHFM